MAAVAVEAVGGCRVAPVGAPVGGGRLRSAAGAERGELLVGELAVVGALLVGGEGRLGAQQGGEPVAVEGGVGDGGPLLLGGDAGLGVVGRVEVDRGVDGGVGQAGHDADVGVGGDELPAAGELLVPAVAGAPVVDGALRDPECRGDRA